MRTSYSRLEQSTCLVADAGAGEELILTGFKSTLLRTSLFYFLSVASLGLLSLWIYWKPACRRWRYSKCSLSDATIVSAEDSSGVVEFCHMVNIHAKGNGSIESRICHDNADAVGDHSSVAQAMSGLGRSNSGSGPSFQRLQDILEDTNGRTDYVVRFFVFHGSRFIYNESRGEFSLLNGLDGRVRCSELAQRYDGWTKEEQEIRRLVFGENIINVKVPSYWTLFYKEALTPFYVFQICSLILWSFDNYYIYAACVLFVSLVSIGFELYETRSQVQSLRDMVSMANAATVTVRRREGVVQVIPSAHLAPGDIVVLAPEAADGFLLPCDAVLLNGSCIADESILTGESVPVVKIPLTANEAEELFDAEKHQKHVVFCGTRIMQTHVVAGDDLLCLVVRTGFSSSKGSLIRSVLYPKMIRFDFHRDSILFLIVLAIVAIAGVVYSMTVFIVRGMEIDKVLTNSLDIITIVVPPTLPAAMSVGIWYSQRRLKSKGIYSTSPQRINLCGKLNLICLDKTGTLTEEGLELTGLFPSSESQFSPIVEHLSTLEFGPLLSCLVTCHNLAIVNGRLIGDSLDMSVFGSTKWVMETNALDTFAPTVVKPASNVGQTTPRRSNVEDLMTSPPLELGILRQFPFSPSLQRCTVIARQLGNFPVAVYCKGAPETIVALCKPDTVPSTFRGLVDKETMLGHRVLALACRYLPTRTLWHHLQRMRREDLEKEMEFLGIVVFRNRLKPSTSAVIDELRWAKIRCAMVTGDSLLTALCVARECGMIRSYEETFIVSAEDSDDGSMNISCKPYPSSAKMPTISYQNSSIVTDGLVNAPRFAMSGTDFALIRDQAPEVFKDIVARGVVFARMRPEQKAQLVEAFQELGFVVGMCGDGANDCSALKAAHAGVSLSDLEASVAAPFTCRVQTIECIPELIKEGRCALVTSFGVFKYMTMYSMIQFISVLTLYSMNLFFADYMYLFIDLAIITVIALLMGRTEASNRLDRKQPSAKLLSLSTILSLLSHVFLLAVIQLLAIFYLRSRKWYAPVHPDPNDELSLSWETTTLFFVSCYQYIMMAVVLSSGYPHRKPFYTNYPFVASLLFFIAILTVSLFARIHFLDSWLELVPISRHLWRFQLSLVLLALLNLVLSSLVEFAFSYWDVDVQRGKVAPPKLIHFNSPAASGCLA